MYQNILITGGLGFIGSHFIKHLKSENIKSNIICVDKLTYAANKDLIFEFENLGVKFYFIDICDYESLFDLFSKYRFDLIVNFAAESHVDNSISDGSSFLKSNIIGVENLLKLACEFSNELFVQISTDEVYGSLGFDDCSSVEDDKICASSIYSASKASAEQLVFAYHKTFGLNYLITRSSNNFGPFQHDEKFIPTILRLFSNGEKIGIYGDGSNIRDWIYVEDNVKFIWDLISCGVCNDVFNIGGGYELSNLELVNRIGSILNVDIDFEFIKDRLGHDLRYSISSEKLRNVIDVNYCDFDTALEKCIKWYIKKY